MGESSFSLAYGAEAAFLPEMVFPTLRVENFEEGTSEEGLQANLDMLEERRVKAHLHNLAYKKAVA